MSIFNELLPKITGISKSISEKFHAELQDAIKKIDKYEEECKNARVKAGDKNQKERHVMQSILEDEDCPPKVAPEPIMRRLSNKSNIDNHGQIDNQSKSSTESDPDQPNRTSKKRNKNEVDDIFSPEVEKRHKRNASVKAQTNITKQVNVNLIQKMRRDNSPEKKEKSQKLRNGKSKDEEDKENNEPVPLTQIKQEKVSLPRDTMEVEVPLAVPGTMELILPVKVEQGTNDEIAMPPPAAPLPKPRKALCKNKSNGEETGEEDTAKRSSTRTRRQKEPTIPPPSSGPSSRALRASSRASRQTEGSEDSAPPPEPRPKRTRAKKKVAENDETIKESHSSQDSGIASPAEKPRPKRTRRGAKAAETKPQEPEEIPAIVNANEDRITMSPILQPSEKSMAKKKLIPDTEGVITIEIEKIKANINGIISSDEDIALDQTRVISQQDVDTEVPCAMDQTVVLPKPVYEHEHHTPKLVNNMNETMVINKCDETVVLDNANKIIMNSTVVIEKESKHVNITDDNSIMTDDSDLPTPPKQNLPPPQPTSAVKEKVQKFEELASRVTRTKTRAMAKNEDQVQAENQTPPDRIVKQTLPMETLQKMNSLIFTGNGPVVSTSANKTRFNGANASKLPTSSSKLSSVKKMREAAEEIILREKEDARKKKEAMLEAKREQQRRKREEKMAAAAAAREAADRERQVALEAAAKDRIDRQAHAQLGKLEKLKEVERKKLELARKVAETEERRKAEEQARQQRLAEEQKRAEASRKKQLEESEALKKEAAIMAKEIEKKQKEYREKQKMKQRFDAATPMKSGARSMEPVHMQDGFQYLNSDEEEEERDSTPTPPWCMSKYRNARLFVQSVLEPAHVDKLFSVRVHSPDLSEIFPNIERSRLKRTSSAVWRTPPVHHHHQHQHHHHDN